MGCPFLVYPLGFCRFRKRSFGKASSLVYPPCFHRPCGLRSSREPTAIRRFKRPNIPKTAIPFGVAVFGVPDWIRTNGTKRRRLVLYPAELMVHIFLLMYYIIFLAQLQAVLHKKSDAPPIFHSRFSAKGRVKAAFQILSHFLSKPLAIGAGIWYNIE